ncbi:Spc97/Spc98_family protein [Hexamita inflata]|uniref:Spc97/Spc98 family protein n=1 Tax=Hexamita inflata TaxID=28002 RepID=A0AA86N7A3_9EUKA|nr:Spc97/Spc98 family protein [Hexamita inflata]
MLAQDLINMLKGQCSESFKPSGITFHQTQHQLPSQSVNLIQFASKAAFSFYYLKYNIDFMQSQLSNSLFVTEQLNSELIFRFQILKNARLPPTKGIQMLITCVRQYLNQHIQHINDLVTDFEQFYSTSMNQHLILNEQENLIHINAFCQFVHANPSVFSPIIFIHQFFDAYSALLYPNLDQFLSTPIISQKQLILNIDNSACLLPTLLNLVHKFHQKLLLDDRPFFTPFYNSVLTFYKSFFTSFVKFGFVSDPFNEFFVQSKLSIANSEQNNIFKGLNNIQNYNETLLVKKLFPFFIDEKSAKEVVVLAKIANEVRNLNLGFENIQFDFVDEFTFNQEFRTLNKQVQEWFWTEILKIKRIQFKFQTSTFLKDILLQIQLATLNNSLVMDTFFVENYPKIQKFKNYTHYQQINQAVVQENKLLKTNLAALQIQTQQSVKDNSKSELYKIIKELNQCINQDMNLELNYLAFQPDAQQYIACNQQFYDLEAEFYQTDTIHTIFPFKINNLLQNIVLNFQPATNTSRLILQPPVQAGFSRIFRQLMSIKAFQYEIDCFLEDQNNLFKAFQQFKTQNQFLQSGAVLQVKLGKLIFQIRNKICDKIQKIGYEIQLQINAVVNKILNVETNGLQELQLSLAQLISQLYQCVRLDDILFYQDITKFYKTFGDFKQYITANKSGIMKWFDVGGVENVEQRLMIQLLGKVVKEWQ